MAERMKSTPDYISRTGRVNVPAKAAVQPGSITGFARRTRWVRPSVDEVERLRDRKLKEEREMATGAVQDT
ncbi:MAG: hypothetical protein ACT4QC_22075, partial [Planctomycetaceae bacterium]